jgi:hypothetical protein
MFGRLLRIEGWAMFGGFGNASEGPRDDDDRSLAPELVAAS